MTSDERAARQRLFQLLLQAARDPDDLHELWLRFGPDLFEADVPYVLTALKHAAVDRYRSEDRRRRREDSYARDPVWSLDALDPAERVSRKLELAGVLDALASLEPRDSWPLWWHVQGLSDPEIAERWDDAGFEPSNPNAAYLRKHRQRTRDRLRQRIAAPNSDGTSD